MKTRLTLLTTIALDLMLVLLTQSVAFAQESGKAGRRDIQPTPNQPKSKIPSPPSPPGADGFYYTYTFEFPGGTPAELLKALERPYSQLHFDISAITNNPNWSFWSAGWQDRLQATEKKFKEFKLDWHSIAEVPTEMYFVHFVRVPPLRLPVIIPLVNGREQDGQMSACAVDMLQRLIAIYNRLGEAKRELGKLVVEGDLLKPSVVMFSSEMASTSAQSLVKTKAFSLAGIPEKVRDDLLRDVELSQDDTFKYKAAIRMRGHEERGEVSIHQNTGLLVAIGPEPYVEMVESIVAVYRSRYKTRDSNADDRKVRRNRTMFAHDENNAAMVLGIGSLNLPNTSAAFLRQLALNSTKGETAGGTPDIRALTVAIRHGDAAAFSRFYDLYSFRLYRFLLVLARGDDNEAREVCQAVFIKLTKRFDLFEDERALWAWLCALAKNAFIDHYRARQRRNRLVPLEELPPGWESGGDSAHRLSEILSGALAGLKHEERELIQAAYIDERPLQELADASGQTYKAVESRLARLRQKLKEQLLRNLRHEHES